MSEEARMRYLMNVVLVFSTFLAISSVGGYSSPDNVIAKFRKVKDIIMSTSDVTIEPVEMYLYLVGLKRLKDEPGQQQTTLNVFRLHNFDKEIDELVEAYKISEQKCNEEWFMKLRAMIEYHKSRRNILNYLNYMKKRLGKFCINLPRFRTDL